MADIATLVMIHPFVKYANLSSNLGQSCSVIFAMPDIILSEANVCDM